MKRLLLVLLVISMLGIFVSCHDTIAPIIPSLDDNKNTTEDPVAPVVDPATSYTVSLPAAAEVTNYVQFTMDGGATFVVELCPEYAPETVANFQNLVYGGFYDGLTFHRIVEDFMIQGGDPKGDGTGSARIKINGEFTSNGFEANTLKHERGVISMARSTSPNSASCQFFIVPQTRASLDGQYAAFGRVVKGMETIDTIAALEVSAQPLSGELSKPVRVPVIQTAYFVNYTPEETIPEGGETQTPAE